MFKNILFILVWILVFFSSETFSQSPWEIDKNKDGILVYTRVEKDSEFKSFKAITIIEASPSEIVKLLINTDGYINWFGYTKTSDILKKESDAQYNYVETIFPWPYKNRDMVYKMVVDTSNSEAVMISLDGLPEYIPEKKRLVRMEKASGYMLLNSRGDNTEVIYVFHSEPGGKIPVRLANNSIAELPFKTLSGMKNVLEAEN